MRAVTYGRVSSSEQAEKGTSLPDQRRRLKARVTADGNDFVKHLEDGGVSGASMDREAMNQVLELVRNGDVDVLYATKLDRLGRTLLGVLELLEEVTRAGCHIRLIDEGIDTSTVAGRMLVQFMSVIAAFERERIAERTVAGRVAAAESGSYVPSIAPYGYRTEGAHKERRLVVDEKESAACRYIVTELVIGRGHAGEIAEELNRRGLRPRRARVWTPDLVRSWARNPAALRNLSGTAEYRGISIPVPAIVDEKEADQWARWQADPHGPNTTQRHGLNFYMLSGMVDEPCGGKAHGRTTTLVTYACRGRLTRKPGHEDCHALSAPRLEAAVVEKVRGLLSDPGVLRAAVGGRDQDSGSPAVALAKVRQAQHDLDEQIAEEISMLREVGLRKEAILASMAPLRQKQDDLQVEARRLERRVSAASSTAAERAVQDAVDALKDGVDSDDPQMWRTVLGILRCVVTVEGHDVCSACEGKVRIGWGKQCPECLNGTEPRLDILIDDTLALSVSERLALRVTG